jgi:hypothetical protein
MTDRINEQRASGESQGSEQNRLLRGRHPTDEGEPRRQAALPLSVLPL